MPAVTSEARPCEITVMSRLSDYLRRLGLARVLRGSRTVALEAESLESYGLRRHPVQVASSEALLADPFHAPRIWTLSTSAPLPDRSHVIAIDGVEQPPASISRPYLSTKQGYLRVRSGVVYQRSGIVIAEPGRAFRNNLLEWIPDHRLVPGFVDFAGGRLVSHEDELRPQSNMHRAVLVLCHAFDHNYGHWLFDCLPYLLPWIGPLQQGRLAVLVSPLTDWQRRTLELLGVPASAVVEASEPSVLCDDLIIPGLSVTDAETTTPRRTRILPQPASSLVQTIQALIAGVSPAAVTDRPERIYVSRRGIESFRSLHNEDEVEAAMMRLGFTIVRPQELPFDEQVATFSRARVIAGPHGAGLTNAAFAPAGCLVVDLCADSWVTAWVSRLTRLFEHHYLPVAFPSDAVQSTPIVINNAIIGQSHIYTVQIETLIPALTIAMRRLGIEKTAVEVTTASPS
jgi:capsular polysaccharide biosynthesis protein